MQVYEYKLDGSKAQYSAIDEAVRIVSSSETSACACGWTSEAFLRMTCSVIVLYSRKNIPLLLVSTHKPDKPQQIVPGLLFPASMTTARTTSQARKAIPSFSTITALLSTKQPAGGSRQTGSTSPSPTAVVSDICDALAI